MANATLNLTHGRQNPLVAIQSITFDQIADTGVAVDVVKLPVGAVVTGGYYTVLSAATGLTSQTIDLDLGTAKLVNDADNEAAAGTTVAFTAASCGKAPLTAAGYVTITPTTVGTATGGSYQVVVEYIIDGRASEAQP